MSAKELMVELLGSMLSLNKQLITVLISIAIMIGIQLSSCNRSSTVGATIGKKVDTVLVVRHDTLRTIDSVLKDRIIYRDTGRIEYVHDALNEIVKPIGNENICIAENQLRQCVKCQDSLEAYKQIVAVDSATIDTLSKLAKTVPDTVKIVPSVLDRVKDIGVGVLIGAGIRSFF